MWDIRKRLGRQMDVLCALLELRVIEVLLAAGHDEHRCTTIERKANIARAIEELDACRCSSNVLLNPLPGINMLFCIFCFNRSHG